MIIHNTVTDAVLARTARTAASFWTRLKGLLGTCELAEGEALVIRPCSSVHTFGMQYPIDVIFISKDNRILKIVDTMKPGKAAACLRSNYVVELPAGTLARTKTGIGDTIVFS